MDETCIALDDCNTEGAFFYTDGFLEVPDDRRKTSVKLWPRMIEVAIGICWNGMPKPYAVEGNAKITARYFIDDVLSPIMKKNIPRLQPEIQRILRAKFQASILTQNWIEEIHPNYISQQHQMANSPDFAPLDYAINGIRKKNLGERQVISIGDLIKVLQEVCANFDLGIIRRSLLSWESRV
ncbi:hypothetical protein RvY_10978 [Ramazzottius varieornatus]|uniref:Uncharacterized protein n=1 Tax=Ramazzottius varieornatus TaxID=947166 RepID=A0A1D1VEK1_RAMVA|nr:hypothetical protein RvY_10978 [Ramazzottius varieornatus]